MKSKFLIWKKETDEGTCLVSSRNPPILVFSRTYKYGLRDVNIELKNFCEGEVRQYISRWKGVKESFVNCPNGYIELPIDLWKCKETNSVCKIQAAVGVNNPNSFIEGCQLERLKAEKIYVSVSDGKYDGFHHVPGRYLCVNCREKSIKEYFKYYYPWELSLLNDFFNIRDVEFRKKVLKSQYSISVSSSYLCASCFKVIVDDLFPGYSSCFDILEIEY